MKLFLNFLPVIAFLTCISAHSQSPPGVNYQGVARDLEGKPLVLKDISIKISILKNSATGEVEFVETHAVKTNLFGLFTLVIGNGQALTGIFEFISWAMGNKWLKVEMDPEGGNYYHLMGAQQFMSVPYAFYSLYSGNGLTAGSGISIANSTITNAGDADNNPTNEIQDLNLAGNVLKITNNAAATSINLGPYLDNTDQQTLSISGSMLGISNGNTVDLSSANANSQNLALASSTLSISGGNSVDLSQVNTDNQSLALTSSGTSRTINISNGNGVTIDVADNDNDSSNEIQDLSLTSNVLKMTNNLTATDIDLSPYLDNTDSQGLTLNPVTNSLGISGNPSTVSLAGYLDNTDAQTLAYNSGTKSLNISGGNSVTIPETQNLNQVLAQGTDAGAQRITNLGAPTNPNDATTKQYVDDADAALSSRIATTYAFKTAFAYANSTPLVVNDQVIPFTTETFDDFNVLGGNSFTALENGIYAFVVDGSYSALIAGGQLSLLFNGVEYPVALVQPWGGSGARFNATMLFKLVAGQTVSLVGDNVLVGGAFNGSFSGYKL